MTMDSTSSSSSSGANVPPNGAPEPTPPASAASAASPTPASAEATPASPAAEPVKQRRWPTGSAHTVPYGTNTIGIVFPEAVRLVDFEHTPGFTIDEWMVGTTKYTDKSWMQRRVERNILVVAQVRNLQNLPNSAMGEWITEDVTQLPQEPVFAPLPQPAAATYNPGAAPTTVGQPTQTVQAPQPPAPVMASQPHVPLPQGQAYAPPSAYVPPPAEMAQEGPGVREEVIQTPQGTQIVQHYKPGMAPPPPSSLHQQSGGQVSFGGGNMVVPPNAVQMGGQYSAPHSNASPQGSPFAPPGQVVQFSGGPGMGPGVGPGHVQMGGQMAGPMHHAQQGHGQQNQQNVQNPQGQGVMMQSLPGQSFQAGGQYAGGGAGMNGGGQGAPPVLVAQQGECILSLSPQRGYDIKKALMGGIISAQEQPALNRIIEDAMQRPIGVPVRPGMNEVVVKITILQAYHILSCIAGRQQREAMDLLAKFEGAQQGISS